MTDFFKAANKSEFKLLTKAKAAAKLEKLWAECADHTPYEEQCAAAMPKYEAAFAEYETKLKKHEELYGKAKTKAAKSSSAAQVLFLCLCL